MSERSGTGGPAEASPPTSGAKPSSPAETRRQEGVNKPIVGRRHAGQPDTVSPGDRSSGGPIPDGSTASTPMPTNITKAELKRIQQTGGSVPIGRTLSALFWTTHPAQALAIGVGVSVVAALIGHPFREVVASGLGVLLIQLSLGLINDLIDQDLDATAQAPRKPLADGVVAPGTVGFLLFLVLLLSIPASLQNGAISALFLFSTLLVGLVHNRALKSGPLSFLGWCLTFALYVPYLTFATWGLGPEPLHLTLPSTSQPGVISLISAALLGLAAHFATALADLDLDKRAELRTLPVLIERAIGERNVRILTVGLGAIAAVGLIWAALSTQLGA